MQLFYICCILSPFDILRVINGDSCTSFIGNLKNLFTDSDFISLSNNYVDRICFDYSDKSVDVYLVCDVKNIKVI